MAETDQDRSVHTTELLQLMAQFGNIGRGPDGGITRLAASAQDGRARDHFCDWIRDNGGDIRIDRIGNVFGIFDLGAERGERALFCGSHLDSQPNGGRFDGAYGVLAGMVAVRELVHRIKDNRQATQYRYLVVCNWTNEEGARFQPSLLGSKVFSGQLDDADAIEITDADGISLGAALKDIGYCGSRDDIPRPDSYVEIHVELGRILEESGKQIGIVTHCWGARKLRVVVEGEPAHTGPTPMAERKDALVAASLLTAAINERARASGQALHGSVGKMEILPNSPNVVPDRVTLWVELRSGEEAVLEGAEAWLEKELRHIEERTGCRGEIMARETRPVQPFDADGITTAEAALHRVQLSHQSLATIAGHDAVALQDICPSTLLFVPSVNGAAHSPKELTEDKDLINGLNALIALLEDMVGNGQAEQTDSREVGA